jgi:RimJ/RimL family protein N-acetyltransferase
MLSLCETCENVRAVRTARSRFLLCELSATSAGYPKYPPQPVLRCDGYRPGTAEAGVRLRPLEPGDLSRMYELQLDPESNRMAVTIPRAREAFAEHWAKVLADPGLTARAVLAGGALVGYVCCFPVDGRDHVGYWIDRGYWGKGIATRALHLLLQEVPNRPLIATVATSNGPSLRVLRKCGFIVEQVRLSPATDRYPECEEAVLVLR